MRAGHIRVIGDQDAVMGLALLGLAGQVVMNAAEAEQALELALRDPDTALILLTENWAQSLQAQVAETVLDSSKAMIVEIPSAVTLTKVDALHERIERSLGLHVGE